MINVHNPTDKPAAIRVKFAAALPNGKPGPISRFFDVKIGPDQVIAIDCAQILEHLGAKPVFLEGMTVVESEVELDVVAIYTAAGASGKVETLGIERVPARVQQ